MNKIKELFVKYREFVLYALFGVVTTVANFLTFCIFTALLGEKLYLFNNAAAWAAGVAVAFITNKLWVFNSKQWTAKIVAKELSEFVGARLFSFVFEEVGMLIFIENFAFANESFELLGFEFSGQIIVKLLLSIVVVLSNYFFSKFVIFKKKK